MPGFFYKKCSGLKNLNKVGGDFDCLTCVMSKKIVRYMCGYCGNEAGSNSTRNGVFIRAFDLRIGKNMVIF